MSKNTACVVGGAGAVGRLFCQLLQSNFEQIKVIDINCNVDNRLEGVEYITGDISNENIYPHLKNANLILLSLPEDPAMDCIFALGNILSPGQCLVETTSVKSKIVGKLQALNAKFEILSINPMFGPTLGFKHQSVACIEVESGPLTDKFKLLMESAGASVIDMSAEQHDRTTAITQVATHAAILSFGLALEKLNYNADNVKPIWTPPHKTLLALLSRILSADPEVYRDIQLSNPYANEARSIMSESLNDLSENVLSGDKQQFAKLFKSLGSVLGSNSDELKKLCEKMFE